MEMRMPVGEFFERVSIIPDRVGREIAVNRQMSEEIIVFQGDLRSKTHPIRVEFTPGAAMAGRRNIAVFEKTA